MTVDSPAAAPPGTRTATAPARPDSAAPSGSGADVGRRRRLLEAALATFGRYGFRKTSMEEVARAAHLSRQGLYLHFSTKEDLFRAVILHALESGLHDAAARLDDPALGLEQKLLGAFDAWVGRYVGLIGADVTDLKEAIDLLGGPQIAQHEQRFIRLVTRTLRASGLPTHYKPAALNARQLAETLHAAARGLKHSCTTRADFTTRMSQAVRALCLPLRPRG
jgi:AcrR family transcriptional regulator